MVTSSLRIVIPVLALLAGAALAEAPPPEDGEYQKLVGGRIVVLFAKQYRDAELALLGRVTRSELVDEAAGRGEMTVTVTRPLKGKPPAELKVRYYKPNCDNTTCGGNGIPASETEFLFLLRPGPNGPYERVLAQNQLASGSAVGDEVTVISQKVKRADLSKFLESPPETIPAP